MSRFITYYKDKEPLEEIDSMTECKWRINDCCCNGDSPYVGDVYCEARLKRKCFVKEDGVIE